MLKRVLGVLLGAILLAVPSVAQVPGGDAITIGRTVIGGGTNGRCLYDNAGKVGEQACGSGTAADITVGTTTVTGAASGDILTRGASALGKLTPGTGVNTALGVNVGTAGSVVVNGGAGGTPSSLVGTNITGTAAGLTAGTASAVALGGITGLGTGVGTALAINVGSAGAPVVLNGAGGTPSSMVGTNITGTASGLTAGTASAVAVGGITGLGTGVATALAINVGSAGAPVVLNGAGGTPSSLTGTNITGTASGLTAGAVAVGGVTGLGTGVATALGNNANASGGVVTTNGTATLTAKTLTYPIVTADTWANVVASSPSTGMEAYVSNAGTGGSKWRYTGSRWKPVNGTATLASRDTVTSGINATPTIVTQYQMPAAFWQVGDRIRVLVSLQKSGGTNTGVINIYVGTAGTTSDATVLTCTCLAAGSRTGSFIWDFRLEDATHVQAMVGPLTGYGQNSTQAINAQQVISNVSNALWISVGINGGATDTVAVTDAQFVTVASAN